MRLRGEEKNKCGKGEGREERRDGGEGMVERKGGSDGSGIEGGIRKDIKGRYGKKTCRKRGGLVSEKWMGKGETGKRGNGEGKVMGERAPDGPSGGCRGLPESVRAATHPAPTRLGPSADVLSLVGCARV